MSRRAPTQAISPSMFRHLAAVTLGVTGLIALFATGEVGEMREEAVAKQRLALAHAEAAAMNKARAAVPKYQGSATLYIQPQNDPSYVPVDDSPSGGDGPTDTIRTERGTFVPASSSQADPTAAGAVLRAEDFGTGPVPGAPGSAKPKPRAIKRKPSQQEIDRLVAESRARSGNAGID